MVYIWKSAYIPTKLFKSQNLPWGKITPSSFRTRPSSSIGVNNWCKKYGAFAKSKGMKNKQKARLGCAYTEDYPHGKWIWVRKGKQAEGRAVVIVLGEWSVEGLAFVGFGLESSGFLAKSWVRGRQICGMNIKQGDLCYCSNVVRVMERPASNSKFTQN